MEEAFSVLEQMIESNDECVYEAPPRDSDISDENNNSMDYEITSEQVRFQNHHLTLDEINF